MNKIPFDLQHGISELHLQAIGLIFVNFARLEASLDAALTELLGLDYSRGNIVATSLTFSRKLDLIQCAYSLKTRKPEAMKLLAKWVKKVKKLNNDRNAIAHGFWSILTNEDTDLVARFTTKVTGKEAGRLRYDGLTAEDLCAVARAMKEAECPIEKLLSYVEAE